MARAASRSHLRRIEPEPGPVPTEPDGTRVEERRTITDVRALAALAHPIRVALLNRLMAFGAATASQCAAAVGASASACSYHLRQLARWGFVEPAPGQDGRERPWRAAATGFTFDPPGQDQAAMAAHQAVAVLQVDEDAALTRDFLRGADTLEPEWQQAVFLGRYALRLTAAELAELTRNLDALIRPYIGLTRPDVPEQARHVHVAVNAFPRPDGGLR